MHQNQPFIFCGGGEWGGELAPKEVKRRMFFHKFLKILPKSDHTPKKEFVRCKSGFLPDFLRF
jgi:hypothetical protein